MNRTLALVSALGAGFDDRRSISATGSPNRGTCSINPSAGNFGTGSSSSPGDSCKDRIDRF